MGYKISIIVATDGSLGGDNNENKLVENRKQETLDGLNQPDQGSGFYDLGPTNSRCSVCLPYHCRP